MAENPDTLIRFLLDDAHTRGLLLAAPGLSAEAARIHGLHDPVATLFGQTLIGSVLLLSIGKGGMRQVLQLDAEKTSRAPIRRMLAEARQGQVRGYLRWSEGVSMMQSHTGKLGAWMGRPVRVSTVRDLGVGQPYVSSILHDSDHLADHLVAYLTQSVQIRADVALVGTTGLLIEAMPGADERRWLQAVEAMASIPDATIESGEPGAILKAFERLGCRKLAEEPVRYACDCNPERMAAALASLKPEELAELADEHGFVTLHCEYCNREYSLPANGASSTARH